MTPKNSHARDALVDVEAFGATDDIEVSRTGRTAYRVLMQVRPLYQASGRAVEHALQGTDVTVPLRALLELVLDRGAMTVPQIARDFGITRQSVQALVDSGASRGLVEFEDNPQHRRSRFVKATELGRRTFTEVHRRELENLDRVTADLDPDDLARCARVLAVLTDRIRQLHHQSQEPA
jgi:DNA-binding MarR family transcriptional regulator